MITRCVLLLTACCSLATGFCFSRSARPPSTTRRFALSPSKSKVDIADWLIAPIRVGESDAGAASRVSLTSEEVVAFPGGGLFFWWQLGWISKSPIIFSDGNARLCGASAGSLAAVCARCGVDTEEALAVALALCERDKVGT